MGSTKEQTIEAFVEPLYLNVSGQEIDRLRVQINKFLEAPLPEEGGFVAGSFSEKHEIIVQGEYEFFEPLAADPGFVKILGGEGPDCAASVINISAEEHCKTTSELQTREWKEAESTLNTDIMCAGLLWLFQQSGKERRKPGSAQYLGLFGYTTLSRQTKTIFCALWRRREPASQVG